MTNPYRTHCFRRSVLRSTWLSLAIHGVAAAFAGQPHRADETPRPPFPRIERTVREHFAGQRDFRSGDIIARGDVAQVLGQLRAIGWDVPNQEQLLNRTLEDQHYLVRTLRSPRGRTFMRKISRQRLPYDKLDRATKLPGGERLIVDLLRSPDADRVFRGGNVVGFQSLARQVPRSSRTPRPSDFVQPTGRIYTVEALLEALRVGYQAETRRLGR
jgi:hypothetical protein